MRVQTVNGGRSRSATWSRALVDTEAFTARSRAPTAVSARRRLGACGLSLCAALACGSPGSPAAPADTDAGPSAVPVPGAGPIVATVDGEPIELADVAEVSRETGLPPLVALRRIEDEVLLHRAALRAGVGADAEDERVVRRAMVQAFLEAEVEERITPSGISDEVVRARRARDAGLFAQPERRRSTHVLARRRAARTDDDDPDTAEHTDAAMARFAARVAEELAGEADPAEAASRYAEENDAGRAFEIRVEDVPPARRDGDVDDAYAAALFALETAGAVSAPVTTSFGVHVIVLTEIVPAWSVPSDELDAILRRQLAVEARAEALVALEDRLLGEHPAVVDADLAVRIPGTAPGSSGP